MNEYRAFLFLVIVGILIAGMAVWAQIQRVRMGYEIRRMQLQYEVLQDDVLRVQRRLYELRAPQALQAQVQRFKLDLQRSTGDNFIHPLLQAATSGAGVEQ